MSYQGGTHIYTSFKYFFNTFYSSDIEGGTEGGNTQPS